MPYKVTFLKKGDSTERTQILEVSHYRLSKRGLETYVFEAWC